MFESKKLIVLYGIIPSNNGIHDTFYLANMGAVSNANTSIVSAWMQVHWGYKKCLCIIAYITEYKTNLEVSLGKNMQIPRKMKNASYCSRTVTSCTIIISFRGSSLHGDDHDTKITPIHHFCSYVLYIECDPNMQMQFFKE